MAKYKLSEQGVVDTERGACIPNSDENLDWREYQEWLAAGGVPDPEDVPPPPTNEDLLSQTDSVMIRSIDWLFDYLLASNVIKKVDLPPELDALYTSRKTLRGL